jgi:hypothetical protein
MANRPVERKVYAATIGAGAGTVVSEFVLWGVDSLWWPAPDVNPPTPVAALINLLIPALVAFTAGWFAKHDPGYVEIDQAEDVSEPLPDV